MSFRDDVCARLDSDNVMVVKTRGDDVGRARPAVTRLAVQADLSALCAILRIRLQIHATVAAGDEAAVWGALREALSILTDSAVAGDAAVIAATSTVLRIGGRHHARASAKRRARAALADRILADL
jgi:hypothetical protein